VGFLANWIRAGNLAAGSDAIALLMGPTLLRAWSGPKLCQSRRAGPAAEADAAYGGPARQRLNQPHGQFAESGPISPSPGGHVVFRGDHHPRSYLDHAVSSKMRPALPGWCGESRRQSVSSASKQGRLVDDRRAIATRCCCPPESHSACSRPVPRPRARGGLLTPLSPLASGKPARPSQHHVVHAPHVAAGGTAERRSPAGGCAGRPIRRQRDPEPGCRWSSVACR